jgi:mRNA interferase HigB
MRIHLIKKETIEGFVRANSQSKKPFEDWMKAIKIADWNNFNEIKNTFRSADLLGLGSNRVVFDIGGNNYRMICKCIFGEKEIHLFICWIGTHADYDKLNKKQEQYTINLY